MNSREITTNNVMLLRIALRKISKLCTYRLT